MKSLPLGTLIVHQSAYGSPESRLLLVVSKTMWANVKCLIVNGDKFAYEIWPENTGYYEQFPETYKLILPTLDK